MKRIASILLIALIASMPMAHAATEGSRYRLAVAPTPRHFPHFTGEDFEFALDITKELDADAIIMTQWTDDALDSVTRNVQAFRAYGRAPIVALSPTVLGGHRSELEIPARVRRRAKKNISFNNPVIREAYIASVVDLARLQVPYFCIATEINLLAIGNPEEYKAYVSLYRDAYNEIKKVAPNTKVFATFQWDWVRIVDHGNGGDTAPQTPILDALRPRDLFGITTYPAPYHNGPEDMVPDYYTWMRKHNVGHNEEIMIMEAGWPTGGAGTPGEQAAFIRRLPELLDGLNVTLVGWALLHDVGIAEFDANLNSVGVRNTDGSAKPGYEALKETFGW